VIADLRLGLYQSVLADIECDAVVTDTPYGERTHAGHDDGVAHSSSGDPRWDTARRRDLGYGFWTPDDVRSFVAHWAQRNRGWFACMSCSDLSPHWRAAFEDAGLTTFQPVACVIRAMSVRLSGDGPSSWSIWLNVARPKRLSKWRTLDGAYVVGREAGGRIGGKPISLMRHVVHDYSQPGDLVCDPCAGYATTGAAALGMGRRFVGAEMDAAVHAEGARRLSLVQPVDLFDPGRATQQGLALDSGRAA